MHLYTGTVATVKTLEFSARPFACAEWWDRKQEIDFGVAVTYGVTIVREPHDLYRSRTAIIFAIKVVVYNEDCTTAR